ncbi:MAG: PorT family protein [Aureispira sp.]|nr:PorT family protein [Aureispira sp.]
MRIIILSICLCIGVNSYAQRFKYGVTSGLNFTRLITKKGTFPNKYKMFFAPTTGVFLNVNIGAGFSAQTSINYSLHGGVKYYKTDTATIKERVAYHSIQTPLFFQYSYKEFIFFRVGGYTSFMTNAYLHKRYGPTDNKGKLINPIKRKIEFTDLKDQFNIVDAGLLISMGMQFANGFNLELRYTQGFTPVLKANNAYNSTLTMKLNYIINYSQKATQFFSNSSRHIIYVEGAGAGVSGSINYEYIFAQHEHIRFSARAGIGVAPFETSKISAVSLPIGIIGIVGKRNHHLELGWVHTSIFESSGASMIGVLSGGYRFQRPQGGLFVRIAYTPYIANYNLKRFGHWGGVSVGYAFMKKKAKPS